MGAHLGGPRNPSTNDVWIILAVYLIATAALVAALSGGLP